jgi:hypothetical protein
LAVGLKKESRKGGDSTFSEETDQRTKGGQRGFKKGSNTEARIEKRAPRRTEEQIEKMERAIRATRETQLCEEETKRRARRARQRREKQRREKGQATGAERAGHGSVEPEDQPAPPAMGTRPTTEEWIPPDDDTLDKDEKGSPPEDGDGYVRPSPEARAPNVREKTKESRAAARRDQYPPQPQTPQAELARLRRQEKKILNDAIREMKTVKRRLKADEGEEAGRQDGKPRAQQIKICGSQKWKFVLWTPDHGWKEFRKHVVRAFALKQIKQWRLEEQHGTRWIQVIEKPLILHEDDDYRVVLPNRKKTPRIRPGKMKRREESVRPKPAEPTVEKPSPKPLKIEMPPRPPRS